MGAAAYPGMAYTETTKGDGVSDHWRDNLAVLARERPALYEQVVGGKAQPVGTLRKTASGAVTLVISDADGSLIPAHDLEDPWRGAVAHLATVAEDFRGVAVFIGMGLGYGPLLFLQQRPQAGRLVIVEPCLDMFVTALQACDLRPLITSEKVDFFVGLPVDWNDFKAAVELFASQEDTTILRHGPSFSWRPSIYRQVDAEGYAVLNQLNVSGGTTRRYGERFLRNRLANLSLLRSSYLVDRLQGVLAGVPAVLVASGPSLTEQLPLLREIGGRCLLIAADGALVPLLEAGVVPDVVTSMDLNPRTFEKLAPCIGENHPFDLVSIFKVAPLIPKRFPARRLLFFAEEDAPQQWFNESLGARVFSEPSSVAHLSLAFAKLVGADPVIFVGQDLAYPDAARQHARGVVNARYDLPEDVLEVEGVTGGMVLTDRGLFEIRRRLEDYIRAHPGTYINASSLGARIEGTVAMSLAEAVGRYLGPRVEITARFDQRLAGACLTTRSRPLQQAIQHSLVLAERVEREFAENDLLIRKLLERLGRLGDRRINGPEALPPSVVSLLEKFNGLNRAIEQKLILWQQVAELTFACHLENEWRKREGKRKRQQGYVVWLAHEVERVRFVHEARRQALKQYLPELRRLSEFFEQEEQLLAQLETAPGDATVRSQLVKLYLEKENYLQARGVLAPLLEQRPVDEEHCFLAGAVAVGLLDFDTADRWFEQIPDASPYQEEISRWRRRHALFWLDQMRTNGSDRPRLFATWMERVLRLGRTDEAVMERLEEFWREEYRRIRQELADGKGDLAGRRVQSWSQFGDRRADWHLLRAQVAAGQSLHHEQVVGSIKTAVELAPESADIQAESARLLIEHGAFEEGIQCLQRAVQLDPQTAVLWEEIGDVLLAAGDVEAAVEAYGRCFVALPDRLDVLCRIGEAYRRTGQAEAARAAYEAVLARDAQHLLARRGLQALDGGADARMSPVSFAAPEAPTP